jgi:hypothetical protein
MMENNKKDIDHADKQPGMMNQADEGEHAITEELPVGLRVADKEQTKSTEDITTTPPKGTAPKETKEESMGLENAKRGNYESDGAEHLRPVEERRPRGQ